MKATDWIKYDFLKTESTLDDEQAYQAAKHIGNGIQLVHDLCRAFDAAKNDRCRCGNVAELNADYCARCVYLRKMGREDEWPWRSAGHR